jgi:propionyl-CoA carboxylase alpha chain
LETAYSIKTKTMKKIVIANRGEIAIRVMKTAHKMGIQTVAVYSEADRNAPHVRLADEAVCIGPPPSNQSYLQGQKIIDVALDLNADAIHPGYGFLSENASFAELVEKNNLIFIGPKAEAIRIMGSKLAAKDAVKSYNIPMVPGIDRAVTDPDEAAKIAREIGFPILRKKMLRNKWNVQSVKQHPLLETALYSSRNISLLLDI